jgi:hypothetical protein
MKKKYYFIFINNEKMRDPSRVLSVSHVIWSVVIPNTKYDLDTWDVYMLGNMAVALFPLREHMKAYVIGRLQYVLTLFDDFFAIKNEEFIREAISGIKQTNVLICILEYAMMHNDLEITKWMHNIKHPRFLIHRRLIFQDVCENGYLEMAKFIEQNYHITFEEVAYDNCSALKRACANGEVDVCQWLKDTWGIEIEHVKKSYEDDVLSEVAINGNVDGVEWFIKHFVPFITRFCLNNNFSMCIQRGYLELAKFFRKKYKSRWEINGNDIVDALLANHDEILRWIFRDFCVYIQDLMRYISLDVFHRAISNDCFDALNVVVEYMDLKRNFPPEFHVIVISTFNEMCEAGQLYEAKWIARKFDIKSRDVKGANDYTLRMSEKNKDVTEWLLKTYYT